MGEEEEEEGGESGGDGKRPRRQAEVLDQWQHCASVLCNAARIPEGR